MRLRNISGSREIIAENEFVIQNPELQKGKWKGIFYNDNPIHIEIGMGKGAFLIKLAEQNPNINYIGIEKYSSVLLRAIEKRENLTINNLFYNCYDAEYICDLFEINEIHRIYLNFSDPWPKERHAKRRLVSKEFLNRYEKILDKNGFIAFKTDNLRLFEFSLEQIRETNWRLDEITYDLHQSKYMKDNIMTEYEEKFSSLGNPIYRLIAYPK